MTHNYVGDNIPLETEFTLLGVAQTPDSGTVEIIDSDNNVIVAAGTAVTAITATVASYDFNNVAEGDYVIFWTLVFGNAKPTRGIQFRVVTKKYENID